MGNIQIKIDLIFFLPMPILVPKLTLSIKCMHLKSTLLDM